jgi:haloacetate dehalogenase
MFFEGFTVAHVPVPGGTIRLRRGGVGPALLLLHGNPQTHAMWHLVAPALAKQRPRRIMRPTPRSRWRRT